MPAIPAVGTASRFGKTLRQVFEEKIGSEHLDAICFVDWHIRRGPTRPRRVGERWQDDWRLQRGAPSLKVYEEARRRYWVANAEIIEDCTKGRRRFAGRHPTNADLVLDIDLHPNSWCRAQLSPCYGRIVYGGTVWREVVEVAPEAAESTGTVNKNASPARVSRADKRRGRLLAEAARYHGNPPLLTWGRALKAAELLWPEEPLLLEKRTSRTWQKAWYAARIELKDFRPLKH